jgi:DNA-directed RNA polymerase specialized sigma24 family protein
MLRAERVDVSCARSRQERAAATADGHAGDVNRAFFDLDEIHRETLLLLLIEQLPKEKTARLMDVSVATMNVRLMQARNALKYALAVNNKSLAYKVNH